jgi:hypothetical protein
MFACPCARRISAKTTILVIEARAMFEGQTSWSKVVKGVKGDIEATKATCIGIVRLFKHCSSKIAFPSGSKALTTRCVSWQRTIQTTASVQAARTRQMSLQKANAGQTLHRSKGAASTAPIDLLVFLRMLHRPWLSCAGTAQHPAFMISCDAHRNPALRQHKRRRMTAQQQKRWNLTSRARSLTVQGHDASAVWKISYRDAAYTNQWQIDSLLEV